MRFLVLCSFFIMAQSAAINESPQYRIVREDVPVPDVHDAFAWDEPEVHLGRIINGFPAADGQFPWAARVSIRANTGNSVCSGSLISSNFLVSALHCVANRVVNSIELSLGSVDRESSTMVRVYSDAWWWIDVAVGSPPDIVVLRLESPIQLSANILPIRLPSIYWEFMTFDNYDSVITGWGLIETGLPRFLQFGHFRITPIAQCGGSFNEFMLCLLGDPNSATATQGGDSGGSYIVYEGASQIPTLVGVHMGRVNNTANFNRQRGVRVSRFLQFINEVTGIPLW